MVWCAPDNSNQPHCLKYNHPFGQEDACMKHHQLLFLNKNVHSSGTKRTSAPTWKYCHTCTQHALAMFSSGNLTSKPCINESPTPVHCPFFPLYRMHHSQSLLPQRTFFTLLYSYAGRQKRYTSTPYGYAVWRPVRSVVSHGDSGKPAVLLSTRRNTDSSGVHPLMPPVVAANGNTGTTEQERASYNIPTWLLSNLHWCSSFKLVL